MFVRGAYNENHSILMRDPFDYDRDDIFVQRFSLAIAILAVAVYATLAIMTGWLVPGLILCR